MSFRKRMKKRKSNLGRRTKQQGATKDKRGRIPTIFNQDNIPNGIEFWKCSENEHIIDILPWFAGDDMPLDDFGKPLSKKGQDDYVLDLFVHTYIGPMKEPFICPYENFGEPCPICEYLKSNFIEDKDLWGKLRPKRRTVYLVWVHDTREEEKKGVQLWEVAHYFVEQEISEIAKLPRGGGVVEFAHADEGKQIAFNKKGKGKKDIKFSGYKFIDRDEPIPDKILDATFALDQAVHMHPSYKAINKAFDSMMENVRPPEVDDDDDDDDDDDIPPRKRKKKTRSSLSRKRKTGKKRTASDDAPAKKKRSTKKKRTKKRKKPVDDVPF